MEADTKYAVISNNAAAGSENLIVPAGEFVLAAETALPFVCTRKPVYEAVKRTFDVAFAAAGRLK